MTEPGAICDAVAVRVSRESGVPLAVLQAITRTETGRKRGKAIQPWPWTVNMEGKGVWFDTIDEARAYARRNFERGARSFDVGCFQINYRWHGQHFDSIDSMFDPLTNGRYAARLLSQLHAEKGTWSAAAGAYHSRTPEYATRYAARFDRFLAALGGAGAGDDVALASYTMDTADPDAAPPGGSDTAPEPRVNRYPLLAGGSGMVMGSLVPIDGLMTPSRFIRHDARGLMP